MITRSLSLSHLKRQKERIRVSFSTRQAEMQTLKWLRYPFSSSANAPPQLKAPTWLDEGSRQWSRGGHGAVGRAGKPGFCFSLSWALRSSWQQTWSRGRDGAKRRSRPANCTILATSFTQKHRRKGKDLGGASALNHAGHCSSQRIHVWS